MFEVERFVEDCRALQRGGDRTRAIHELLCHELDDASGVLTALGEPGEAGITRLYVGSDLTILNVVWGPHMTVMPHNHNMWAVIGIYTGREDNVFWRRLPGDAQGRIEAAGATALSVKECVPLGKDIIHSVTNPVRRLSGAIHIYGGDFFRTPRSEWDPETLEEGPYDVEQLLRLFEEFNTRLRAS